MAGNRGAYEEAMQEGASTAWDQNWDESVAAYQRALAEFPDDASALAGLGLAYSGTGQLEAALDVYQRASVLDPEDPVLLERLGETRERLGQGREAAEAYLASAERYLSKQQAAHLALERWRDATRACPDLVEPHMQLLQYYQGEGQAQEAVEECLALARIYQAERKLDHAAKICEHALKLAPHDPDVLTALDNLRLAEQGGAEPEATALGETGSSGLDIFDLAAPEVETLEDRGSPVAITRQKALTDLAESVFEEEMEVMGPAVAPRLSKAEIDALIGRAIDLQTRGGVDEAIDAYEEVLRAGVDRPAVHFNLGLLYQEKLRFDAAIDRFRHAVSDPEYTLGSRFALGECYRAKGRVDEALQHFIEALKIVDMATVQREHADNLIQLYEHLADGYVAKGEREQAIEFTGALVTFLSEQGWEDKVIQARRRLDALAEEGPTISLAEVLTTPDAERILESVALAQEYAKRGMYYAALEESYSTLQQAPTYVPTHRQIAQVLLEMGKPEEAAAKFVAIADTYLSQGKVRQAVAMYKRVLKLSPMDTAVRAKLIDILISHGQIEDALEHYLMLAESYYNLAQMDRARDTYEEALRLAPRSAPGRQWTVRILHKIGDIDMQCVDWKRATEIYERIRKMAPDDERARLTLMDLYYRLGRPELAVMELDDLLKVCREAGKVERTFVILEDAVAERPEDVPLLTRLAQAHLDAGNVEQALQHLDRLGDLQLNAGRPEDARATIRAIIALNPPNIVAYQQLLEQIEG